MIIDIILVIIMGVISLIAALLLPSKAKIEKNETAVYKTSKPLIYAAGGGAIAIGVLLLLLFAVDKEYQQLANIGKLAFLMVIGIALISVNLKKSKFLAKYESAEVTTIPGTITGTEVEIVAPEVLTKHVVQPLEAAQPQVQTPQTVVAATPTVKAQPQVVAQQPQPAPTVKPKSKIVVIKCPKCKGDMQIDTSMVGQKMKCPHCGVEGKIG